MGLGFQGGLDDDLDASIWFYGPAGNLTLNALFQVIVEVCTAFYTVYCEA